MVVVGASEGRELVVMEVVVEEAGWWWRWWRRKGPRGGGYGGGGGRVSAPSPLPLGFNDGSCCLVTYLHTGTH